MMRVSTAVLIHGCHLQADLKGKTWEDIVWGLDADGNPTLAARATMGLLVALDWHADLTIFSTGASERDGLKEGEYTLQWARDHTAQLRPVLGYIKPTLDAFLAGKTVELDLESQNTREECARNFTLCAARGIKRIILVSSAWHIMRCHAEALKVAAMMRDQGQTVPEIIAIASHDSTEGTLVIEPSHRGDQKPNGFTGYLGGIYKVPPGQLDEFENRLHALIAEYST